MKTIAIVSQKGGVGKSTITRHLAVQAASGGCVAIADLDAQATTKKWLTRREKANINPKISMLETTASNLTRMHEKAQSLGIDWLFIDTPPAHDDTRAVTAAILVADLVIIPTKPSPDDIEAMAQTITLVNDAGQDFVFVLNMIKRCNLLEQSRKLLTKYGDLSEIEIRDTVAFPEASMQGAAINEINPKHKGSQDIAALWQWVKEKL